MFKRETLQRCVLNIDSKFNPVSGEIPYSYTVVYELIFQYGIDDIIYWMFPVRFDTDLSGMDLTEYYYDLMYLLVAEYGIDTGDFTVEEFFDNAYRIYFTPYIDYYEYLIKSYFEPLDLNRVVNISVTSIDLKLNKVSIEIIYEQR